MEWVKFSFNDIIYAQIDKVLMGSPLGPVLVLWDFMKTFFLKNATSLMFIITMWMMHFSVFNSIEEDEAFRLQLNSLYLSLQFTMEVEYDLSLTFLNVLV